MLNDEDISDLAEERQATYEFLDDNNVPLNTTLSKPEASVFIAHVLMEAQRSDYLLRFTKANFAREHGGKMPTEDEWAALFSEENYGAWYMHKTHPQSHAFELNFALAAADFVRSQDPLSYATLLEWLEHTLLKDAGFDKGAIINRTPAHFAEDQSALLESHETLKQLESSLEGRLSVGGKVFSASEDEVGALQMYFDIKNDIDRSFDKILLNGMHLSTPKKKALYKELNDNQYSMMYYDTENLERVSAGENAVMLDNYKELFLRDVFFELFMAHTNIQLLNTTGLKPGLMEELELNAAQNQFNLAVALIHDIVDSPEAVSEIVKDGDEEGFGYPDFNHYFLSKQPVGAKQSFAKLAEGEFNKLVAEYQFPAPLKQPGIQH